MTIRAVSKKLGIQPASLQRRISRKGLGSYKVDDNLPDSVFRVLSGEDQPLGGIITKEKRNRPVQRRKTAKKKSNLQEHLSADWLIIAVLVVILFADMTAFAIIGQHEFSGQIIFSPVIFSIIGLATGIGSVVTYNRIKDTKTAEVWKWTFGLLQFLVFSLSINESWFLAELTMTSMFVLVFIGVQRSIKQ